MQIDWKQLLEEVIDVNAIIINRFLIGLLFTTFLLFAGHQLSAQSSSAEVTLNIRFMPVQTISVNSSDEKIDLLYADTENYENGVSVTRDNHLTVFSSSGFQVTVQTAADQFVRSGGKETIPTDDVIVKAYNGSSNKVPALFTDVPLSASPTPLISATQGGNNLAFTVTYDNSEAGSGKKYINRYRSGQPEIVYTTTVIYCITTR